MFIESEFEMSMRSKDDPGICLISNQERWILGLVLIPIALAQNDGEADHII